MSTPERDLAAYDARVSAEQERELAIERSAEMLYMGIPLWLRRIIPDELQGHCRTEALRMLNDSAAEAALDRAIEEDFYKSFLYGVQHGTDHANR